MSFMRTNRALNRVPQPEALDGPAAAAQAREERLSPNLAPLGAPQKRTFEPDLTTLERISALHREAAVSGSVFPLADYEEHIPYGPHASSREGLDGEPDGNGE